MKALKPWSPLHVGDLSRPPLFAGREVMQKLGLCPMAYARILRAHKIEPRMQFRDRKLYDLNDFKSAINSQEGRTVFEIQKGIPVPPRRVLLPRIQLARHSLNALEPGDSVWMPKVDADPLVVWVRLHNLDKSYTTRTEEGGLRIWRLS